MRYLFVIITFAAVGDLHADTRLSYLDSDLQVELQASSSQSRGQISVLENVADTPSTSKLPIEMIDIRTVRHIGNVLAVQGRDHFSDLLVVYTLPELEMVDFIRGRQISLSPSGQFAVFERYFPPKGALAYQSHLTLTYDLLRTPELNRNRYSDTAVEEQTSILVGIPTYPDRYRREDRYQIQPEGDRSLYSQLLQRDAGYVWSLDDRAIAFSLSDQNRNILVILELDDRGGVANTHEIDLMELSEDFKRVAYVKEIMFRGDHVLLKTATQDLSNDYIIQIAWRQ